MLHSFCFSSESLLVGYTASHHRHGMLKFEDRKLVLKEWHSVTLKIIVLCKVIIYINVIIGDITSVNMPSPFQFCNAFPHLAGDEE